MSESNKENKIAIVTPLKDEIDSIKRLIQSIESQSIKIYSWIIIENDSVDGSKEYLDRINTVKNVDHFKVINISFSDKSYALGVKYSTVVKKGFEFIEKEIGLNDINYLGILDADCFPKEKYYEKLIDSFKVEDGLGITSGRIVFENGKEHFINDNHVRGSGRLWSIECYKDTGYMIGMSADTLSATKARLHSWKVIVTSNAEMISREAGARVGFEYYGKASYFRGDTIIYAILRSLKNACYLRFDFAYRFLSGYLSSMIAGESRVEDEEIKKYYKNRIFR